MRITRMIVYFLSAALLLAGCVTQELPDATAGQIQCDWMAGESPIPARRTGLERSGLTHADAEVTADGVYFIYSHPHRVLGETPVGPVILYADHDSDTVIKLCGRADCPHNTEACNAYIEDGTQITYSGGYLYAVSGDSSEESCELVRMDSDGSNRVAVLDLLTFARENGGDFVQCSMMTEGYLLFSTYQWVEDPDGSFSGAWLESYTYKLDGTLGAPRAIESSGWNLYNCGDVLLTLTNEAQSGSAYGGYWDWDIETDTMSYLTDHPGVPGYFGKEEAYYFKDGAICRLTYATGAEEILVETGLAGSYYAHCFPDCLVLASKEMRSTSDMNLYIYNWAFELVDTVALDYRENLFGTSKAIIAETAERFILTDSTNGLPCYYINKSELGTGNVDIRELDLTDLAEERQYFLEEFEDQQWLDGN